MFIFHHNIISFYYKKTILIFIVFYRGILRDTAWSKGGLVLKFT